MDRKVAIEWFLGREPFDRQSCNILRANERHSRVPSACVDFVLVLEGQIEPI